MKPLLKPLLVLSLALGLAACPEDDPAPTPDTQEDVSATPDADATGTADDGGATPDDGGTTPDDGGTTPDDGPDVAGDADGGTSDADGGTSDADGGTSDAEGDADATADGETSNLPAAPALGALIDRAGRPGIATALIGEFTGTDGTSDDAYNTTEPGDWAGTWTDEIASNLAIYDALDATCGNQLLNPGDGATNADAYFALATVLVDDRLYVDSGETTCASYLGVELGLTDCGGRAPSYDVIDATYTVLSNDGTLAVSDGVDGDDGTVDESTFPFLDAEGLAFPPVPALGSLIDRAGRPGITTALIGEFTGTDGDPSDNAYQLDEPSDWSANWAGEIATNLAIYDALDASCGNQLLYTAPTSETSYDVLAGALADDRLYLNSASSTCGQYLAVEADATGVVPNSDCGGRAPSYDIIDTTYSVLAAGALTGVGDGVPSDDGTVDETTFPFLDAPGLPFPNPPTLGALIDRAGRPGVTTALIGEFTGTDGDPSDNAYQLDEPADWSANWAQEIAANLAIYDALDASCGNQLLYTAPTSESSYDVLAGALADDRLYLNSASSTCGQYLAVEADATGVVPNSDCGGRAPSYDIIDTTYSVLAAGALTGVGDGVPSDDATVDESTFPFLADPTPAPPALGALIDRAGRPGVTTALIGEFTGTDGDPSDNAYQLDEPADWSANWAAEIAANLAIYDALDASCGNQLLYGAPTSSTSYDGLAGALADDRLYLNSASSTCGQYLAVEADATGVVPNADCGGRAPSYDVIDTTYSVLAAGALAGVGDGVAADDAVVDETAFPFLAAPQ